MSERRMAVSHTWQLPPGAFQAVGQPREVRADGAGPMLTGNASWNEAVAELLRVVAERTALHALAGRQHALLKAEETFYAESDPGPHCPTCGGVHDGDQQLHTDDCERQALLLDRDGFVALAERDEAAATLREALATVQSLSERLVDLGKEVVAAEARGAALARSAILEMARNMRVGDLRELIRYLEIDAGAPALAEEIARIQSLGAALVVEHCRRLAEEIADEGVMSASFRLGWRGGLRRLVEMLPATPESTELVRQLGFREFLRRLQERAGGANGDAQV